MDKGRQDNNDCETMSVRLLTRDPNTGIAWFDDISLIKLEEEIIIKR